MVNTVDIYVDVFTLSNEEWSRVCLWYFRVCGGTIEVDFWGGIRRRLRG